MRLDSIKMHGTTVKKKIIFWRSTVLISGCTLVILNKVSHSFLRYLQQNLWTKTQTTPQLFTVTTYIVPCSRLLLGKFSSSANQQNSPCFMETEVSLRVHNISTSLPMPSQINPVHSLQTDWISILLLSSHLHLGYSCGLFPSGFPTKTLYAPLLATIHATRPAHLILLEVSPSIFLHMSFKITLASNATQCQLLKTSFYTSKNYPLKGQEWRTEEKCGNRIHYNGSQISIPKSSEHESVRTVRQRKVRFQIVAQFERSNNSRGLRIIATSN